MIRTVVKPSNRNISISLPEEFVGKQVEVIAFTIEEADNTAESMDNISTHFATETVLAKSWLTADEDEAWQDL
ncbi:hypothetical protein [Mucilaginibacter kameinonensis]|uniref:hypothetical protein n=1 Tax=Mucilaginibacter kameinonensis TaxID=452286 RepID=UPI000EF7600F|nr:hypothetical protein [Mucilaginibacter kameinonensis]